MYSKFSIINIIFFIYIFSNQINYSYGSDDLIVYTYENITDYISKIEYAKSSLFIRVYDKDRTLNKIEVLKLKNHHYYSYYCKNNICVQINRNNLPEYVEIPDDKGNIKGYISDSYSYEDLKLGNYRNIISLYSGIFIYKCTSDSQCLTNKCINGFCIYNKENPTEFCTYIYSHTFFSSHSYMHCGKLEGDICKTNKECASVKCSLYGFCKAPPKGPSDNDGINDFVEFILLAGISIPIFVYICFRCSIKPIKKNRYNDKIKYKN